MYVKNHISYLTPEELLSKYPVLERTKKLTVKDLKFLVSLGFLEDDPQNKKQLHIRESSVFTLAKIMNEVFESRKLKIPILTGNHRQTRIV